MYVRMYVCYLPAMYKNFYYHFHFTEKDNPSCFTFVRQCFYFLFYYFYIFFYCSLNNVGWDLSKENDCWFDWTIWQKVQQYKKYIKMLLLLLNEIHVIYMYKGRWIWSHYPGMYCQEQLRAKARVLQTHGLYLQASWIPMFVVMDIVLKSVSFVTIIFSLLPISTKRRQELCTCTCKNSFLFCK